MEAIINKIVQNHQNKIQSIISRYIENKKILDIGCGNGINSVFFNQKYGADITLLDREDIREKEAAKFPFVEMSLGERLPFNNGSFDAIFLQYVLHHLPPEISITSVLRELGRVSGVIILVEEIFTDKTDAKKAREFDFKMNKILHPASDMAIYRYYTDEKLKEYFDGANLNIIEENVLDEGSEEDGYLQRKAYILGS